MGGYGGGGVGEIHLGNFSLKAQGSHFMVCAGTRYPCVPRDPSNPLQPLISPQIAPEKALPGVWGAA